MIRHIQIDFPEPVELTGAQQQELMRLCSEITAAFEKAHPGRVMWPAGIGYLPTFYNWPCRKCGIEQGEHKEHIIEPKAGDCDFEPASKS